MLNNTSSPHSEILSGFISVKKEKNSEMERGECTQPSMKLYDKVNNGNKNKSEN